jgi:hypothetical protein
MPRVKAAVNLLWALLSFLEPVALAHVTGFINPAEEVNGLWLVVAAALLSVGLLCFGAAAFVLVQRRGLFTWILELL